MSVEELRKDADELRKLSELATRRRVSDLLTLELRRVETEIIQRSEQQTGDSNTNSNTGADNSVPVLTKPAQPRAYTVQLTTYAWDQSEKFMKIYVTLEGVQSISSSNISCQFTDQSFKLLVNGLNGRNYELFVANLSENIIPEESYHKIKSDMVLVMMKKVKANTTWAFVTQREKKEKAFKTPEAEKDKDPQESMMGLLKQMYDDGDDDMRRTIQKSFYESQNKKMGDI